MLRGQLVLLRPVKRNDSKFYLKWCNDPEVIQYDISYLPLTEMEQEKWWNKESTPDGKTAHFMVDAVDSFIPKPIGFGGLHDINPKNCNASIGIVIGEIEYWSRGYGTEAVGLIIKYGFEQLNLHRIFSEVYSFNQRSLGLCLKIGFREEGRQREAVYKNGAYHDEVLFGLLKDEWRKLKPTERDSPLI